MSTANEQKILDAANTLTQAASALQSGVKAKEERIAQLEAKIKELGEQPPPEDLSQEFGEFDKAMADIQNLANNLTPASGGSGSGTQENVPNVSGTPITQPATETPLAGESGTTNPAVEGGGPLIDQQAPGVPVEVAPDSGNSEAPASSEEGEAPADKPADSENPFA